MTAIVLVALVVAGAVAGVGIAGAYGEVYTARGPSAPPVSVDAVADPERDLAKIAVVERHLGTCPGCAEYLEQLRTVAGSLRGLTDESFPPEMRDGVISVDRNGMVLLMNEGAQRLAGRHQLVAVVMRTRRA